MTQLERQIERCALMGWQHIGEGLFSHGQSMGWFTDRGFFKE